MYGSESATAAASGGLAYTGLATGSWLLIAFALLMIGLTLWMLGRRSKRRRDNQRP